MTEKMAEGGCLCESIRFRTNGEPIWVAYCHCADCRRASGAPVTVFVGYRKDAVSILDGAPRVYASSPGIRRSFCGRCGTPLAYEDERLPGEIHFMLGAFDAPERFAPARHAWESQRVSWLHIDDALPRHEGNSKPRP